MHWLSPIALCGWVWIALVAYWAWAARKTAATKATEGLFARLGHVLPLLAAFLLIFHSPDHNLVHGRWHDSRIVGFAGLAVTVAGLLFMAWGRVHLGRYWSGMVTLKEGHRLVRTGPYAIVRHPLYTGFLLAAAGSALAAGTVDAALGFALLSAAYLVKLRREEALLTKEFGEEYLRFKREVPALVPFAF